MGLGVSPLCQQFGCRCREHCKHHRILETFLGFSDVRLKVFNYCQFIEKKSEAAQLPSSLKRCTALDVNEAEMNWQKKGEEKHRMTSERIT